MSNSQYPPRGTLGRNKYKDAENKPDYTGKLEISKEVVLDLVNQLKADPSLDRAVCQLGGWKKVSKDGNQFISIKANKKYESGGGSNNVRNSPSQQSADLDNVIDDDIPF